MSRFNSPDAYRNFARRIRNVNRFILNDETQDFLQALAEQAHASRAIVLPKDFLFWRAQIAHDTELQPIRDGEEVVDEIEIDVPCRPERMKSRKGLAREGRSNPKGISYLYLSNRREIALSEVRPWLGALISVAQFNRFVT